MPAQQKAQRVAYQVSDAFPNGARFDRAVAQEDWELSDGSSRPVKGSRKELSGVEARARHFDVDVIHESVIVPAGEIVPDWVNPYVLMVAQATGVVRSVMVSD